MTLTTTISFYIFGTLTGIFLMLMFRYKKKYEKTKDRNSTLSEENSLLKRYKNKRESRKRKAKYTTTGWHRTGKNLSQKERNTRWDVIFHLEETGERTEEKSQFKVTKVYNTCPITKSWGDQQYIDWFMQQTGGGWLRRNNSKLDFIINQSKADIREDKIDDILGIK